MKKKLLILLTMVLVMGFCSVGFAACSKPEEKIEPSALKITDGVFEFAYGNDTTRLVDFLSFSEDGVFYHWMQRSPKGGYWKLVQEEFNYELPDGKHTAPAYIELTDFRGRPYSNTLGENKYAVKDGFIYRITWGDSNFKQVISADHEETEKKNPATVGHFEFANNSLLSIDLKHTGIFVDTVTGTEIKGNWKFDAPTKVYTLTSTGGSATFEMKDGLGQYTEVAVYTAIDKTKYNIINPLTARTLQHTFNVTSETVVSRLELYKDGAGALFFGNAEGVDEIDTATWKYNVAKQEMTLAFAGKENIQIVTSELIYSFEYTYKEVAYTFEMPILVQQDVSKKFNGTTDHPNYSALSPVFTSAFYADGSLEIALSLTIPGAGVQSNTVYGTWVEADNKIAITIDNDVEIIATKNEDDCFIFTYKDAALAGGRMVFDAQFIQEVPVYSFSGVLTLPNPGMDMFITTKECIFYVDGSALLKWGGDLSAATGGAVGVDAGSVAGTWAEADGIITLTLGGTPIVVTKDDKGKYTFTFSTRYANATDITLVFTIVTTQAE